VLRGEVTEFDEVRGLGTITGPHGTRYLFHCIEIADGMRTIEVGRRVVFQPLPKFGRIQAGRVTKV
jgi:cold shock CspA family protein